MRVFGQQTRTLVGVDDQRWLGSRADIEYAKTFTLDVTTLTGATHYPQGFILSGLPVGLNTTTGLVGLQVDANTDGTQNLIGFLLEPVTLIANEYGEDAIWQPQTAPATAPGVSILLRGMIRTALLPFAPGTAGKAANKNFIYR